MSSSRVKWLKASGKDSCGQDDRIVRPNRLNDPLAAWNVGKNPDQPPIPQLLMWMPDDPACSFEGSHQDPLRFEPVKHNLGSTLGATAITALGSPWARWSRPQRVKGVTDGRWCARSRSATTLAQHRALPSIYPRRHNSRVSRAQSRSALSSIPASLAVISRCTSSARNRPRPVTVRRKQIIDHRSKVADEPRANRRPKT